MRRTFAVFAAVMLGLLVSAGQAMAQAPGGSAEQAAANAAASAQSALGLAGALQGSPSNTNTAAPAVSPSVAPAASPSVAPAASPSVAPAASPSTAGSVSQSNTVIGGSVAANGNSTNQTANQTQGGGSGTQTAGQIASNDQSAVSSADAAQLGAANENIDVRVFSPGNGGSVSQANTVLAGSLAGNHNQTTQTANQTQAGAPAPYAAAPSSGYGQAGGTQTVGQAASNKQDADSYADAKQYGAKNSNISVRIFSPGNDGSVEQSNTVAGISAALNGNSTKQTANQGSSGGGGTQTALQGAISHQGAKSSADAEQKGAKNENIAVRIFSEGNGGSVSQSNTAIAGSLAANGNATTQNASQNRSGGGYGSSQQVVGQAAGNHQDAWSDADATQYGASNTNIPVRIFSDGDDGAVEQSNTVLGLSAALNGNETTQSASQSQSGGAPAPKPVPYLNSLPYAEEDPYSDNHKQHYPDKDKQDAGPGVQAIGQIAESKQGAVAESDATQIGASNTNVPVRIGSEGDAGSVSQANTTISAAIAVNENGTSQTATQNQSGHGTLVQGIAQAAKNHQGALAFSDALQKDATNTNAPVDVFSKGDHKDDKYDKNDRYDKNDHQDGAGSVSQSNTAAAIGVALNGNSTTQSATQNQAGGSPLVQAVGQWAENDQFALGKGDAYQRDVANSNTPIVVGHDYDKHKCDYRKHRCEPKKPVEPKCDWKDKCDHPSEPPKCDWRDKCDRPSEPPKCDWKKDECQPKHPVEPRKCEPRKEQCEWKRPVQPPTCEPQMPAYEPCDRCERHESKCPSRRGYAE